MRSFEGNSVLQRAASSGAVSGKLLYKTTETLLWRSNVGRGLFERAKNNDDFPDTGNCFKKKLLILLLT